MSNINYPYQVVSIKQEKNGVKKTLGVDAQLSSPNYDNEREHNMPLEMHSGYSRFVMTLIQKEEKRTIFPKANIPADDAAFIFEKTKVALQCIANAKTMVQTGENSAPLSDAYTEKFTMGIFKGKSPAEVLLENPGNKQALIDQGVFLSKNAEKFPANKKKMAAIKDALNLLKTGKLEKVEAPAAASSVIEIYNEQMKSLISTKDEDGRCLVYGIKMVCDTSRNLPFAITINNCRTTVVVAKNGTMQPKMKEAVDVQNITMNLSEKDFYKVVFRMMATLKNFEEGTFAVQMKQATSADFENRNAAKKG